jgi:hypothetical protein
VTNHYQHNSNIHYGSLLTGMKFSLYRQPGYTTPHMQFKSASKPSSLELSLTFLCLKINETTKPIMI